MTAWIARVWAFGENVVVPEGQCWPATEPSGDGEREDTVGNDASELGCEERGTALIGSKVDGQCSLFVASIYYI